MNELETALRETLQEREQDICTTPRYVVPTAKVQHRVWASHRRSGLPLLVAAALVAVVGVVGAASHYASRDPDRVALVGGELVGPVIAAPAGMQVVSSRGVQVTVPASWTINNTGCNQTSAPTVVRGLMMGNDCYTPEPADQDIVEIGASDVEWLPIQLTPNYVEPGSPVPPEIQLEPVHVDGHEGERGTGTLPDGRHVALLRFPQDDIGVAIRSTSEDTANEVLDSVRFSDVDDAGCRSTRPDVLGYIGESGDDPLSDLDSATSATMCLYAYADDGSLLASSTVVEGSALERIESQIRALAFVTFATDDCSDPITTPRIDTLMALRQDDGSIGYVGVGAYSCGSAAYMATHEGWAIVPQDFAVAIVDALHEQGPP